MKRKGMALLLGLASRHACRHGTGKPGAALPPLAVALAYSHAAQEWQPWEHSSGAWRALATSAQLRGSAECAGGANVSEHDFQKAADHTLEELANSFDALLEGNDIEGSDLEYGQGVLTLKLGELGTYVINKQAPNHQIWMSSPVRHIKLSRLCSGPGSCGTGTSFRMHCGPVRYDLEGGRWVYHRDGHDMHARLVEELEHLCGAAPDLDVP